MVLIWQTLLPWNKPTVDLVEAFDKGGWDFIIIYGCQIRHQQVPEVQVSDGVAMDGHSHLDDPI